MDQNDFTYCDQPKNNLIYKQNLNQLFQTFKTTDGCVAACLDQRERNTAFVQAGMKLGNLTAECPPQVMNILVNTIVELNEYKQQLDSERNKSMHDELTGIYNRRYLMEEGFPKAISYAIRYNEPISAIMIDVNNFKGINDTYGHIIGDEIIRHVAQTLKTSIRDTDIVARYGGDEFCVACPHTNIIGVQKLAQRIQKSIEQQTFTKDDFTLKITVSTGVNCRENIGRQVNDSQPEETEKLIKDLINGADIKLYQNKKEYKAQGA